MDDQRYLDRTGRSLDGWVALLDSLGSRDLDHADIARLVPEHYPTAVANPGWWAQSIAVAYEQAIGRRVVGQTCEGDFQTAVSRTLPVKRQEAVAAWQRLMDGRPEVDGVPFDGEAVVSQTEKWSRWRIRMADGTRVVAQAYDKTVDPPRSVLSVTHEKLPDKDRVARAKAVWKALVAQL